MTGEREPHRRPVIPPEFDPTFAGEPDTESGIEPPDEPLDGLLQMVERHPEFESLRDPEDDTLELPAEELAMHVETRPPD